MAYRVTVTATRLEEGVVDGVMTFKCPRCGENVLAEPDADDTCCQDCGTMILVDNPYF